jgi:hypothetical protein
MDYADVERIAGVYGLQTTFNRAQERANEHFVTALPAPACSRTRIRPMRSG